MKDDKDDNDAAAEQMSKRGAKGARAAHAALFDEIDKAEHLNDHRKTGAAILGATLLYRSVLNSLVKGGPEYDAARDLAYGLFNEHLAEGLLELAKGRS